MGFYTYGTKPHAVTGVTGGTSTLSYTYDNNGNMQAGANRSVTWNSFNMVSQITQGANTLMFNYDNDHARIKEVGPNGTTIYLNPRLDSGQHFEKVTTTSGVIEYKQYLYAGNLPIGVYTSRSNGQNDTKYFHTDHLGSIAVVTNESGAVLARYNYDPFGNRTVVAGTDVTDHGFTGHETMVEVGLVNMNGRVYDPALARFMSADPNIQAPGNGQSFNRYSYVMNNPLSYTDPTGYGWLSDFIHNPVKTLTNTWHNVERSTVGRAAIIIAVAYFTGDWASSSYENYAANTVLDGGTPWAIGGSISTTSGVIGGAAGGFSAGFVGSNGDLQSGLRGAASGALLGGVDGYYGTASSMERVAAKAFAGGVAAKMQGGRFEDGFMNSGFTSGARYIYNTLAGYDVTAAPGENRPGDTDYEFNKSSGNYGRLKPQDIGRNIIGFNENYEGKDCFLCRDAFRQGSPLSKALNIVPGINAIGGLDDFLNNRAPTSLGESNWFKAVTIPTSVALTLPALLDRVPVYRPLDPFGRR